MPGRILKKAQALVAAAACAQEKEQEAGRPGQITDDVLAYAEHDAVVVDLRSEFAQAVVEVVGLFADSYAGQVLRLDAGQIVGLASVDEPQAEQGVGIIGIGGQAAPGAFFRFLCHAVKLCVEHGVDGGARVAEEVVGGYE